MGETHFSLGVRSYFITAATGYLTLKFMAFMVTGGAGALSCLLPATCCWPRETLSVLSVPCLRRSGQGRAGQAVVTLLHHTTERASSDSVPDVHTGATPRHAAPRRATLEADETDM